ncbi:MAG TPA: hypothetical protein VFY19_09040 [Geminicoccaceae bacterium]|nr:hypothetical protein [Geminicoccaceae bacterium]
MQPLNPSPSAPPAHGGPSFRRAAGALALTAALVGGTAELAAAPCPWIVQPYTENAQVASSAPTFDIVFDGLGQSSKVFYGFTVASLDLAWQLANERTLPELAPDGRRLEARATPQGTIAYQLSPDSIQPHTIYLVAAGSLVRELEQIDARIEPARPLALSELMPKTRGGTDWSGPLPHRSLPGFEIAGVADRASPVLADVQICAYQVAMH